MSSEPLPTRAGTSSPERRPADDDRITRLVARHQRAVFAYLGSLGCPPELVEDLAQETFVAALRGGLVERHAGAARAWLRTVARSRYLDHLRRSRGSAGVDLDEVDQAWRGFDRDDGGASYLEAMRACMEALADRERRALELRYGKGLDRTRVAEAFGLSLGGVKSLVAKAKARLRACVERRLA